MASAKLSAQDRKDLEKYFKFLAIKIGQVIVASREGLKIKTDSSKSSSEWVSGNETLEFNVKTCDLPLIVQDLKNQIGEPGTMRWPVCIEMSIKTSEGTRMVLETFCLEKNPDQCDPSIRGTNTVYNRMTILVKSLITDLRLTPAYRLSRAQTPDCYCFCYRFYCEKPQFHGLGDGYIKKEVGHVITQLGTIRLIMAYRTKMTITPTQTGSNDKIVVESNHFGPDMQQKQENEECILSRHLKRGAFVDPKIITYPTASPKPFEKLWEKPKLKQSTTTESPKTDTESESTVQSNIMKENDSAWKPPERPMYIAMADPDYSHSTVATNLHFFFKDAPPLESFEEAPTLAEQNLLSQIEEFQKKAPEYNSFVKELLKNTKYEENDEEEEDERTKCKSRNEKKTDSFESDNKENIERCARFESDNSETNCLKPRDNNENSNSENERLHDPNNEADIVNDVKNNN